LRIDAESIDLTLSPRRMAAKGTVKSTLQPSAGGDPEGGGRRPGLPGDTAPAIVGPGTMTYDEAARPAGHTAPARPLARATRTCRLGDTEPVIVVSETMPYGEVARRGVYTGQARLLQGDTQIFAETITLDETNGNLGAKGNVRTTLALAQAEPDANGSPSNSADPTIVVASTFAYTDETRRAVY